MRQESGMYDLVNTGPWRNFADVKFFTIHSSAGKL